MKTPGRWDRVGMAFILDTRSIADFCCFFPSDSPDDSAELCPTVKHRIMTEAEGSRLDGEVKQDILLQRLSKDSQIVALP